MKKLLVSCLGVLVFCGLFLALFQSQLGLGIWLLPVLLLACLIAHLWGEVNALRQRVRALEERLPAEPEPAIETDGEKLERLYRSYSDQKLQKVMESREYREDAKELARQILKERAERSGTESL